MTPVALAQDSGRLAPRRGADPELFVEELERQLAGALERLAGPAQGAGQPPGTAAPLADLLTAALRDAIESSEVAAVWMASELDLELKLAFARLCGDEARHYQILLERAEALGMGAARLDPLSRGHSPLFRYLKGLETPAERIAAGAFAREAIGLAQNRAFSAQCEAQGDLETARLYREVIGPEEAAHHDLGRRLLVRFAVTPEDQERARRAVARTVQLAEQRREPAKGRRVPGPAPGC